MGYYMDNGAKKITDNIHFIGKGEIDGKNVEISFETDQILVIRENNVPKLTVYPSFNKEKETFFEMKTINEEKPEGDDRMLYEIILVNGTVLNCWTESVDNIVEMMLTDDIYAVQENEHPMSVTYLMPERVSYYRFPNDAKNVVRPR